MSTRNREKLRTEKVQAERALKEAWVADGMPSIPRMSQITRELYNEMRQATERLIMVDELEAARPTYSDSLVESSARLVLSLVKAADRTDKRLAATAAIVARKNRLYTSEEEALYRRLNIRNNS